MRSGTSFPAPPRRRLIKKKLKFYVIDALTVAKATGMGARINTIMQTCFFALSGVLPREEAIEQIKYTIKKTYGRKGEEVVKKNIAAVDQTLANLFEVKVPAQVTSTKETSRSLHAPMPPRKSPRRWASSMATAAKNCRSAPSARTARSRPARPATRSATWRSKSPSGTRRPASSAASA